MNWIKHKGSIDFLQSRKAVVDVAASLMLSLPDNPSAEYYAIYPLYQLGLLEYGKTSKGLRLFPCYSGIVSSLGRWEYSPQTYEPRYQLIKEEVKEKQNVESFFRLIPDLKSCIMNWSAIHVTNLKFALNLNKHRYEASKDVFKGINICKQTDKVWSEKYIRINETDFLIPSSSEEPEAFRIAKCYAMASNNIPLFKYEGESLKCLNYQDLPVPIIRGLLIASPNNLSNEKLYHYNYQMEFYGISKNIVKQMERIFSVTLL